MKKATKNQKKKCLWLDELSTIQAKKAGEDGEVVIFPIGSVEEHGEHLPLCTDSIQPEYVALEVAKRTGCLVAPPFRYGICNATRNFAGTLTIKFDTLYKVAFDVLSELVRNGFTKIIVLSGHAGSSHMVALRLAAQEIVTQNDSSEKGKVRIMVMSDYDFALDLAPKFTSHDDGHAGTLETARIMAIAPNLIKAKGAPSQWNIPRFEVVAHPEDYFPSGIHGDPTAATVEMGEKLNRYVVEQIEKLVWEIKK